MPLKIARDVLVADSAVMALVADRISPVETSQATDWPCVVLTLVDGEVNNTLQGNAGLDRNLIHVDAYAFTYASALQIANACRAALDIAGHYCISRISDQYEFEKDPGTYRVGYQFQVWK